MAKPLWPSMVHVFLGPVNATMGRLRRGPACLSDTAIGPCAPGRPFFAEFKNTPLWLDDGELTPELRALIRRLAQDNPTGAHQRSTANCKSSASCCRPSRAIRRGLSAGATRARRGSHLSSEPLDEFSEESPEVDPGVPASGQAQGARDAELVQGSLQPLNIRLDACCVSILAADSDIDIVDQSLEPGGIFQFRITPREGRRGIPQPPPRHYANGGEHLWVEKGEL